MFSRIKDWWNKPGDELSKTIDEVIVVARQYERRNILVLIAEKKASTKVSDVASITLLDELAAVITAQDTTIKLS